jgi:hypothetical protein
MKLPPEMFFTIVELDRYGQGCADFTTTLDDAVEQAAEYLDRDLPYRVLKVLPATGDAIEVTEEVGKILFIRMLERGYNVDELGAAE